MEPEPLSPPIKSSPFGEKNGGPGLVACCEWRRLKCGFSEAGLRFVHWKQDRTGPVAVTRVSQVPVMAKQVCSDMTGPWSMNSGQQGKVGISKHRCGMTRPQCSSGSKAGRPPARLLLGLIPGCTKSEQEGTGRRQSGCRARWFAQGPSGNSAWVKGASSSDLSQRVSDPHISTKGLLRKVTT